MDGISRRRLLHIAVTSAAATAAVTALPGCSGGAPEPFGDVGAGSANDLAVGQIRAVPGAPAFVARDANGVYAMTTTCTHQGCDMATGVQNGTIYCSCHGSAFDPDGNVLRGPANAPLQHFAVTIDPSGAMTVHGKEPVSASTRA